MWSRIRNLNKLFSLTHSRISPFCVQATGPNFDVITNGDKELEHKLKVLTLEVDVMRQEGNKVPDEQFLEDKHWKELLELPTFSGRRRYLEYLFKLSKTIENRKIKKEQKQMEREATKPPKIENETFEDFVSTYDLSHNNLMLRVYDSTMNNHYNNKLVQAMQFGQQIIIDCGYYDKMTKRENVNCAKQLTLLFAENRAHDDPYDVHLCNVNHESDLMVQLAKSIGTLYEPWFPLHLHTSSYLEKFPKENLVYLTPHCREELEYDHDAIYIIGGIVDKVNTEPLSLATAKREGLKMAKLPLDRYLQWGGGSGKSLTLNQVIAILLDVKTTGNWNHALRHVPKRKITEITPQTLQKPKWTPTNKVNFDELSYRGGKSRTNIRSLFQE